MLERSPPGARVLVAGSSEAALANPGLLPALLDWLLDDALLLDIRPQPTAPRPLRRLPPRALWLTRAAVVGVPVLLLWGLGLAIRRWR